MSFKQRVAVRISRLLFFFNYIHYLSGYRQVEQVLQGLFRQKYALLLAQIK